LEKRHLAAVAATEQQILSRDDRGANCVGPTGARFRAPGQIGRIDVVEAGTIDFVSCADHQHGSGIDVWHQPGAECLLLGAQVRQTAIHVRQGDALEFGQSAACGQ
jgi:hypothetical protein